MGQSPLPLLRQLMLLCLLVLPVHGYSAPVPTSNEVASELKHFKELSKLQLESTRDLLQKDMQTLTARLGELDVRQVQRLDDQNKRLDSLSEHIDQNLTIVGYIFGGFSLLVALAGIAGYVSVQGRAKEEARTAAAEVVSEKAREAVDQWFREQAKIHEVQLKELQQRLQLVDTQMQKLEAKSQQLDYETATLSSKLQQYAEEAKTHKDKSVGEIQAAAAAVREAQEAALKEQLTPEQQQVLTGAGQKAKDKPESQYDWDDWDDRAFAALAEHDTQEAIRCWEKIIQMTAVPAEEKSRAMFNKGVALGQQSQPEAALAVYGELIQRFGNDTTEDIRERVAAAMLNKGITLGQQSQPEAALAVYGELIQRFGNDRTEEICERVAAAMLNKGFTLSQQNQPEAELATYDELIRRFGNDTAEGIRERVAKAMLCKGFTLGQQNQPEAELATYDELIRRFGNDMAEGVREQVAKAILNKGVVHGNQNEPKAQLVVYDELIQRFSNDTAEGIRELVAKVMLNKSVTLGQQNQPEAEQASYDELIRRFGSDTAENIRQAVARAKNSKGFTLLCRAKQHWSDETTRSADLQQARQLFVEALNDCSDEARSMVLGNQSYCTHLLAEPSDFVRPTLKQAMELGDEKIYKGTLDDLAIHPVPEKDEPFRALLEEVWSEVHTEKNQ